MSFSYLNFVLNFKDPATLYAHSLISVHHDVMWYLILALSAIYWALYKILREFSWFSFSKQIGLLRRSYLNDTFFNTEIYFVRVWSVFFFYISSMFFDFLKRIEYFIFESDLNDDAKVFFLMGREYLTGYCDVALLDLNYLRFEFFEDIVTQKYLDYFLFNRINIAYYYYDEEFLDVNSFLTVQRFRHSTVFEFVWATFPTTIILMILVPSMLLLYSLDEDLDPKLTIKVIGHQWFWSYEFDNWLEVSENQFEYFTYDFDSCLVVDDYLTLGDKRLLEVDMPLIVPVNTTIRFLITSSDVVHAWSVPELGIKIDAVPGRLSQYLSLVRRPGFFYGQCSELCGVAHGFMPIVILAI